MLWITRPLLISEVTPGMILARPAMSEDRSILLNENTVLTESMISLLASWGVQSLYVKELHRESGGGRTTLVSEQRRFLDQYSETIYFMRDVFNRARKLKEVSAEEMDKIAGRTAASLVNTTGIISHLSAVPTDVDLTCRHSLNVGIIAGMIGKWLKFSEPMLKDIVLTGLLHDIGKTQLPPELLNKSGKLSAVEMEVIKEHPVSGYKLLEDCDNLSQSVRYGVLQHHERLDGSGYPAGLSGGSIFDYARIISIADIYDAMTGRRAYATPLTPFRVVAEVFDGMFAELDPEVAIPFISNVREALIGFIVRLSDGNEARVIYLDKERPAQPIVRMADGAYVDLERRKDLHIVEMVAG